MYARAMIRDSSLTRMKTAVAVALVILVGAPACGKSLQTRAAAPSSASPTPRAPAAPVRVTSTAAPALSDPASIRRATPSPSPPSPVHSGPPKPRIVQHPIPFGPKRKAEMAAYARRHYGIDTYRLIHPHVIVIHYTETPDFSSTYNTFAPDVPDSELHELPGTCAHFVIDQAGIIHQLVPLSIMCRHTVGLNWTAIGIEHVGYSDTEVLDNRRQMAASLALTRWLRCRFHIAAANVIGHNESLSSPYHHERVAAWRNQTHSDFNHAHMQVYRARLRALGGC
jgi:N-acetylmuramoyl-L-alanine amidase